MNDGGKIYLIQEILYGLDDEEIRSFAGKKTSGLHDKKMDFLKLKWSVANKQNIE